MTVSLAHFQNAFIDALYADPDCSSAPGTVQSQPGFSVYRNTVLKACIDALAGNYPSVVVLTGAAWMREAALAYARASPPSCNSLHHYGQNFPGFITSYPAADSVPYLAGVARLDCCWIAAHVAGDHTALKAADIAHLAPEALGTTRLRPHPSANWAWFPDMPVYTIWNACRESGTPPSDMAWRGEGALLVRRDNVVHWQLLDEGACSFLDACASGCTLEQACEHALLTDSALDISGTLSVLINTAALCMPERPRATSKVIDNASSL